MLGYLLLREGKVKEAEDVCTRAARLKEPPVEALINLGVIRFSEGRDDEAHRLWESAQKVDPKHPLAAINLERPKSRPPRRDVDLRYLARSMTETGTAELANALAGFGKDYSDADRIRLLEEAAQFDPNALLPQQNLANLCLREGPFRDTGRALWHARRAVAIARDSRDDKAVAGSLSALGRALLASGKADEARAALEEGKTKAPAEMVPEFERLLDSLKRPGN
jgi:tetratricopeptide (TPR) repeat protein